MEFLERAPSSGRLVATPGVASASISVPIQQQYETPLHPCGFVFKFLLLSTWSDVHYVGLDGIELVDLQGRVLRPKTVHCTQGSVRDMPGMVKDVRTVDNLLHGAPGDSGRMWLAPFSRVSTTVVELVFDKPARVSCIRVWNYTRTPSRGVRDIEVYVDDILVYQGILRQGTASGSAPINPTRSAGAAVVTAGLGRSHESILFTSSPEIVGRERSMIYIPSSDQVVAFIDQTGTVDVLRTRPGLPSGLPERPTTALVS